MLGVEMFEQCDCILARQLKTIKMPCEHGTHVGGDTVEKLLVRLVDEMVLIAQRKAIRDAHADIFVRADDQFRALLNLCELAWHPTVDVLHGGDAGRNHLERGIERVKVEVEVPGHQARGEPQFERHVGGAELDRRQANMVVAIDETGQQRLLTRADNRRIRVGAAQLIERADRTDDAIAL